MSYFNHDIECVSGASWSANLLVLVSDTHPTHNVTKFSRPTFTVENMISYFLFVSFVLSFTLGTR